jgi:hypothetical protein
MSVLFLARCDYANLGYILAQCLEKVGVKADVLVENKHQCDYPDQGIKFDSINQVKKYAQKADIIQFMHSQRVKTGVDLSKKRVFVLHGGTAYRERYKKINKIFNPIVEKSIIQTADLFGLGAKNEVWLLPAVDVDKLKPAYERKSNKIIIGHFPSNARVKSSKDIANVIGRLSRDLGHRFEYIFSPDSVPWDKQMRRVAECDIYIDACTPNLKSKRSSRKYKYGEWGLAALEAAALGKIVISHFLSQEKYKQEYGECGIQVANSFNEIEHHLRNLLVLGNDELTKIKKSTRRWVEKYHNFEVVGKKLKEVIYEI